MDLRLEFDAENLIKAFEKAPKRTLRELRRGLKESCSAVQLAAKRKHRFKARTGALNRAVRYYVDDEELEGLVYLDDIAAPYAYFVHAGTEPHDIFPNTRKALRFRRKYARHFTFAKHVKHPGTQEDEFLYNAADAKRGLVRYLFYRRTQAALEAAGLI